MDWFDITLRWYLVTLLASIAFLPATHWLFHRLTDRGAAFARPVSLLILIWPTWFLSGITGADIFSGIGLWATLVIVTIGLWAWAWRTNRISRDILVHVGIAEAGYLIAFAAFLWFHGYGPQATDTEKPSDLMMLASSMLSNHVPPSDAWLAGHDINYYDLGYNLWGAIGKMTGARPAEAFNLALISVFATTFITAAGLVTNVAAHFTRVTVSRVAGAAAGILVLLAGNPWATFTALGNWTDQWTFVGLPPDSLPYFGGIGWRASRTIVDDPNWGYNPIAEFPSFSFVLGDLHPHVMALPYTLLALALAWMLLSLGRLKDGESLLQRDGLRIAVAGAAIGSLYAMNSWDFPTYLVIGIFCLALGTATIVVRERLIALIILCASSVIAWLPFYLHFTAPTRSSGSAAADRMADIPVVGGVLASLGFWEKHRTTPQEYFGIFGFMYAVAITLILLAVWERREGVMIGRAEARGGTWERDPAATWFASVTAALCFIGSLVVPAPLLVICGLPVIIIVLLLERDFRVTPGNIALVLFAFALILTLVPEFFFLNDIYGGSRMNTVFKVYYQVWVLMAIASALAGVETWTKLRRIAVTRIAVPAIAAAIVLLSLVYPVVAGKQWLDWRSPANEWYGVDGLGYLNSGQYRGEYDAIIWLIDHASADDVVLTAGGGEWHAESGRVSGGSGVPTLLGWDGHERQWHLDDPTFGQEITTRINDIITLYGGAPAIGVANESGLPPQELLDAYSVDYIYIGPTEQNGVVGVPMQGEGGAQNALGPFPAAQSDDYPGLGWTLVFDQDGSRIYQRNT